MPINVHPSEIPTKETHRCPTKETHRVDDIQ